VESSAKETIRVQQVKLVDAANDPLDQDYDSAIEVQYPDHKVDYLTAHYHKGATSGSWGVTQDYAHYNLIATDPPTANGAPVPVVGDQTITVGDLNGDGEGTPVNAVLIGGDGNDVLQYRGRGHAVLIGGGGNNQPTRARPRPRARPPARWSSAAPSTPASPTPCRSRSPAGSRP
jgi:hypothetical protein